jgi:hypothetical protein
VLFTDNIFSEVFRNFNQKIYGYYYKNDIHNLKKIMSVDNMQSISQSTVSEIKRIKSSEKRETLKFYDAIIRHFKNIGNLTYQKQNYNKLEVANEHFIKFDKDYWKRKEFFVVMDIRAIFAFHLMRYKFLFKLLISLNKLRHLMIRANKKIVSIFTFQTKSKVEDVIYMSDKDLNASIWPIKSRHSSDIISRQRTIKNKIILSFLYRL